MKKMIKPISSMNKQLAMETQVESMVVFLRKGFMVLGFALVVGLGFIAFRNYQESKSEKAFGELFLAEKIEELAEREGAALQKKSFEVMKTWPDDKKNDYVSKLQNVYTNYPGQMAAAMAGLKLGRWYLDTGDYAQAENHYLKMLGDFKASKNPDKNIVRVLVIEGLGFVLEENQKWAEAEKYYKEASDLSENPLKPLSLMGLARAQRKLSKNDEAKKTYEKIFTDFPESQFEKKARALSALLDQPKSEG